MTDPRPEIYEIGFDSHDTAMGDVLPIEPSQDMQSILDQGSVAISEVTKASDYDEANEEQNLNTGNPSRADYELFAQQNFGEFPDIDLLITAFTHRSFPGESLRSVKTNNERLEFLGDAVIEIVVTEFLYSKMDDSEGAMTSVRSGLVNNVNLAGVAERLGFEPLIRLSRGQRNDIQRVHARIMACTYEAVVGALDIVKGRDSSATFVHNTLLGDFDEFIARGGQRDPKSHLQEYTQAQYGVTPQYRNIRAEGQPHDRNYVVGVFLGEKMLGSGSGPSQKRAQVEAAIDGFINLADSAYDPDADLQKEHSPYPPDKADSVKEPEDVVSVELTKSGQAFIEFVVKSLVSKPEEVIVERSIDEKGVLLKITVAPEELGRVIGKDGNTAQALRTILRVFGMNNDARYSMVVVDNNKTLLDIVAETTSSE